MESMMEHSAIKKADLDWPNLSFAYMKTDYTVRSTWRDGVWSPPERSDSFDINMSVVNAVVRTTVAAFTMRVRNRAVRLRASITYVVVATA